MSFVYPTASADHTSGDTRGLSLRDHFAGIAMREFLSGGRGIATTFGKRHLQIMAMVAYDAADAMLSQRKFHKDI
jgi:hypothetical protein